MKNLITYILLILSYSLFNYLFAFELQSDNYIRNSLAGEYTEDIINNYIKNRKDWIFIGYLIIPIIIIVRSYLIALSIQVIIEIKSYNSETIKNKYRLSDFLSIALFAEWATVFAIAFKFIWFAFIQTDYTLQDLHSFIPLSLISYINKENYETWLLYPLSLINLWEFFYWLCLIAGIQNLLKSSYIKSFEIVLLSYGSLIFIWVIFIMYLLINMS